MSIQNWDATLPTSTTPIVDIPIFHTENWEAIEEFFDKEHYTFTSPASGRHIRSRFPIVNITESASSLPSLLEGGMVYARDTGENFIKLNNQVKAIHNLDISMVNAHLSEQYVVNPGLHFIPYDVENKDVLSEWTTSGSQPSPYFFNPKTEGKYLVSYRIAVTCSKVLSLISSYIVIYNFETDKYYNAGYDEKRIYSLAQKYILSNQVILHLTPKERLRIRFVLTAQSGTSATIFDGNSNSSIWIRRLS